MPVREVPNGLWARKHDMPGTPAHVPVIAYPTGLADLIELCKRSDGTKYKAAGSHWALSTAAMSDHTYIETHDPDDLHEAMDRTLYDVVPRGLSGPFVDHLVSRLQPEFGNEAAWSPLFRDESSCFVHVEAGKRIYQLYAELDKNDAAEGLSAFLQPKNSSYQGPWAFRTLGGAGGQTVVGALTTGTHGGDFHGPPLADDVVAIHLVVDGGRHYWIEPDPDPDVPQMVDDETLHKLYGAQKYPEGSFEVVRSTTLFNAVLVSAGRFGVIYSVVLRAVRQYCLHEDRHLTTWEEIRDDIGTYSSDLYRTSDTDPNHFLQVAVSVTAHANFSQHLAGVTRRWKVAPEPDANEPNGRKERRGEPGPPPPGSVIHSPFFDQAGRSIAYSPDPDKPNAALPMSMLELACMDGEFLIGIIESVIEEIRKLVDENQVVAGSAAAAIVVTGSGAELLALAAPLLALLALLLTYLAAKAAEGGVHRNGQVLNEVKDVLLDHDDPGMRAAGLFIWQAISYKVFKGRQEDQNYTAISYAVMDQHNYLDQSCEVNVDSIEVFFEANDPMLLAFVDALLAYEIRQERQGKAFAGYISLRFTGPTRALIGEQRWPMSCAVEVAGLKDVTGVTELIDFAIASSRDRNYGGILHWGQRNESNTADIEHRFGDGATPAGGDIGAWRRELAQLTHDGQRDAFSSAFTRQVGLEVT
ncbi:MAG: hypothetical protein WKF76_13480 [Nocardioidaceae bacterium]